MRLRSVCVDWGEMGRAVHQTITGPGLALTLALAVAAGCSDPDRPYVEIEGGGFIFNYRIAEVFYGVSVRPLRTLGPGTVLEAEFEDPAGGPALVVRETVGQPRLAYTLHSPPVTGVVKARGYRVEVRVLEAATGKLLSRLETELKSEIDQSIMPDAPLTVGPGYAPNPAARTLQ